MVAAIPAPDDVVSLAADLGSVAVKLAALDRSGSCVFSLCRRIDGRPREALRAALGEARAAMSSHSCRLVAMTGNAARPVAAQLGVPFVNEVLAVALAVRSRFPAARSAIEMGGQDSKLLWLPPAGDPRPFDDFAVTGNCAAGTGSFLDQQALRLGVAIEGEFGRMALASKHPPTVAGRCSVFAKSDMIHLQQKATPMGDILAGLCFGLVRNLRAVLARGASLPEPVVFCGGVAANAGVVWAVRDVFGLTPSQLIVPGDHVFMAALGAAMSARNGGVPLSDAVISQIGDTDPASPVGDSVPLRPLKLVTPRLDSAAPVVAGGRLWLGVDVGSISTKAAVIDDQGRVVAKVYHRTAGRPLDAVSGVLKALAPQLPADVVLSGVGATGSGRYLVADYIAADLAVNEITAQAAAAAAIDPAVESVFEIGGQDSKYIGLLGGVVVDFEMNHACAAGTGSFIEEQAQRLSLDVERDFSPLAFASTKPIRLGERCTVFIESDLQTHLDSGASREDLVAGLSYSIVSNYLNRVVGSRRVGERVFFQGGTAFNQAVLSAFREVTGRDVVVPPHHEVTGAIGAAILARRHMDRAGNPQSRFPGLHVPLKSFALTSFACSHCANACEVNRVEVQDSSPLHYGARCDRYDHRQATREAGGVDPFTRRNRLMMAHAHLAEAAKNSGPRVGLPLALLNYQLLPFWGTLLQSLGLRPVLSPGTTRAITQLGVQSVLANPCFPVKLGHGHALHLASQDIDFLLLPSVIAMRGEFAENEHQQVCPFIQSLPWQLRAVFHGQGKSPALLTPEVRFDRGLEPLSRAIVRGLQPLGLSARSIGDAVTLALRAQQEFESACVAAGRETLADLAPGALAVVLVGRPYNTCDRGANLDLPAKLARLGVTALPLDFLDLSAQATTGDSVIAGMYWKYGQRILRAARIIREDPRLGAVYVSNFGCGPDSFLIGYFRRILSPKPSLVVELDEHSADAGLVTRIEAFVESVRSSPASRLAGSAQPLLASPVPNDIEGRTIHVPWMGPQSHALAAALTGCGARSVVMPPSDGASLDLGRRHCAGKECLPCLLTTGDMLKVTQEPGFDPGAHAFLMPGTCGPCRFGQYSHLQRLILSDVGLPSVPILSPSQNDGFQGDWSTIQDESAALGWLAICGAEILERARLRVRPYAASPQDVDALHESLLSDFCRLLETRPSTKRIARLFADQLPRWQALLPSDAPRRPVIGLIGEIYVRHHDWANDNIVRRLELLGAEVSVAGMAEWIYYTNWAHQDELVSESRWRPWVSSKLADTWQRIAHRRLWKPMAPLLGAFHEPKSRRLLEMARPWLPDSFRGEAILSVGKAVELAHIGSAGIVNVMPFGCMPSTVVSGLSRSIERAVGGLPVISLSYDGQPDGSLLTRIEAFVEQCRARRRPLVRA